MSEVEKLMKKTELKNKEKSDFPLGATIGFLIVGALCSLGADNFWGTFGIIATIILFFAFISSNVKPINASSKSISTENDSASSDEQLWWNDTKFSTVEGNKYHN